MNRLIDRGKIIGFIIGILVGLLMSYSIKGIRMAARTEEIAEFESLYSFHRTNVKQIDSCTMSVLRRISRQMDIDSTLSRKSSDSTKLLLAESFSCLLGASQVFLHYETVYQADSILLRKYSGD